MVASQARPAYIYDTTLGDWVPMSGVVDTGQAYTFAAHQTFNGGIGATSTLDLKTGGTTRLSVDSSGRVILPSQPAFRATGASAGVGANLSFATNDTAFAGRNSGWNGSSRFTAPVAGVYHFTFAFLVANTAPSYQRVLFKINGVQSTTYGDTLTDGHATYATCSMGMHFRLSVNDYVELFNEGAALYSPAGYGSFSGVLVG